MRYAIRNIGRLKLRSFLTFAMAFAVLFLAMFGSLIVSLCEDNRNRFYGPLDGSFHVTNEEYAPYLTYDAAVTISSASGEISGVSAVKEYTGVLDGVDYVGKGEFLRDRFPGEPVPYGTNVEYTIGFTVVGVTSMDIVSEMYGGDLKIIDGTMITRKNNEAHHNKIVISKEVAELNGLKIGDNVVLDRITLYSTERHLAGYSKCNERNRCIYTVGGIYENARDNISAASEPSRVNANRVYIPLSTISDISMDSDLKTNYLLNLIDEDPALVPDALYFHISDRKAAAALEEDINDIGFAEKIVLTEYMSDAASSPSARLSEIVSMLLVGVIVVGLAVFFLSVLFNMKARHRELAVLSALGKSRSGITLSFFAELLILVLAALVLGGGLLIAAVCTFAVPMTKYLYSAELSAQFTSETATGHLFGDMSGDGVAERMSNISELLTDYAVPSLIFAVIAGAVIMAAMYVFIRIYVGKINALSGVGGKE